ncbi:hypothetical protein [Litoreibacter roseus]|uniref:Uncharacterized protein n=1 Tax=Litoreibacter roseus TaxID=2601869 RepID=A0A6N6JCW8_9RHOB|nr:hypothetical protein [Litoreibacter roseus]GFE64181.1 hypothetical protein KIN_12550 [Litoreibacter roseus]
MSRILSIICMLAASGAAWFAYDQISILRRTWLWELRFVVLLVAGFLLLTFAEWIFAKITGLISKPEEPETH